MVPGINIGGGTLIVQENNDKHHCHLYKYLVFRELKEIGAYVNGFILAEIVMSKGIQNYYEKPIINEEKAYRLFLVLFVARCLRNGSEVFIRRYCKEIF